MRQPLNSHSAATQQPLYSHPIATVFCSTFEASLRGGLPSLLYMLRKKTVLVGPCTNAEILQNKTVAIGWLLSGCYIFVGDATTHFEKHNFGEPPRSKLFRETWKSGKLNGRQQPRTTPLHPRFRRRSDRPARNALFWRTTPVITNFHVVCCVGKRRTLEN